MHGRIPRWGFVDIRYALRGREEAEVVFGVRGLFGIAMPVLFDTNESFNNLFELTMKQAVVSRLCLYCIKDSKRCSLTREYGFEQQ